MNLPTHAKPDDRGTRARGRRWLRLGAKALHDIAAIAYGGALAACLVVNGFAEVASADAFAASRALFAAIARVVLLPSMAVVVLSGLLALAATRGYLDAGWAWLKAVLGISVFQATLVVVGSGSRQAELLQAAATGDAGLLASLLQSERHTLWLLVALSVANVLLAVWRPRLTVRVR